MNLTLNDLVMAEQPLQQLITKEMPAKVAFCLARIIRRVNIELKDYMIARDALLRRLGELSEDETQYFIELENRTEFNAEMQALHSAQVELNISRMSEDDLPDLTAADAMALWWLVKEPDELNGEEESDG